MNKTERKDFLIIATQYKFINELLNKACKKQNIDNHEQLQTYVFNMAYHNNILTKSLVKFGPQISEAIIELNKK